VPDVSYVPLRAAELVAKVDEVLALQGRAMGTAGADRRDIVLRHAGYPAYRGVAAKAPDGTLLGFAYGYASSPGQWWNGQVRRVLGDAVAAERLDGAFELAELHVEPAAQGAGIGRRLLYGVTADLAAGRVVLSAKVDNARARKLFEAAGFQTLYEGLWARPGNVGAAVLGAALPLVAITENSDLPGLVHAVVDANRYLTLGTSEIDGRPRLSPVYFTHRDYRAFYWVSAPEAQHSRNVAVRPDVSLVIYDSTAPIGKGQAVYLTAVANEVPRVELAAECAAAFSDPRAGAVSFTPAELTAPSPLRLYRARITAYEVHVPGSDPIRGRGIDYRLTVHM
jgi:ribosomal protein S18 acetylase RimI-like enzyme/nitroimidazol reductase NimA-like FMN-containing flavoprotein (pyridoxamine 5'-phosphate oxidase superfamily)